MNKKFNKSLTTPAHKKSKNFHMNWSLVLNSKCSTVTSTLKVQPFTLYSRDSQPTNHLSPCSLSLPLWWIISFSHHPEERCCTCWINGDLSTFTHPIIPLCPTSLLPMWLPSLLRIYDSLGQSCWHHQSCVLMPKRPGGGGLQSELRAITLILWLMLDS